MRRAWAWAYTIIDKLRKEHVSPARIGVAVGVGVLIGCSPFWGLHFLIALGVATLFRLNRLAVLVGTQISMPPLTPLLLFGNAQLGSWIITGKGLSLSFAELRSMPAKLLVTSLFWDLFVGGLVLGGGLALVLGYGAAALVHRQRLRDSTRETT
jgi:uncharacterized protein (DUF2062 family)